MHDDELMDQLLREAMTAEAPQLSPAFDARVMRRIRPRRLTPADRLVLVAYFVVTATTAAWLMRDLPLTWIAASAGMGVAAAAAASAYARRFAFGPTSSSP